MKIAIVFILLTLGIALGYHTQPYHAQPYHRRHPQDSHSIGMTFQTPPANEGDEFIESMISMVLSELKDMHIDSYPVEDGEFKNVNIKVDFPPTNALTFRADPNENSMLFKLHGVKVDVDTDLDMYYGTIKGHGKFAIDNMDVDLKTTPQNVNGEDTVHIQYHLHLKDADIVADINALEDTDHLPAEFQEGFSMFDSLSSNYRIAAVNMIDDTFEKQTQDVLQNYFNSMSSQYRIPRKVDHQVRLFLLNFIEPRRYYSKCKGCFIFSWRRFFNWN